MRFGFGPLRVEAFDGAVIFAMSIIYLAVLIVTILPLAILAFVGVKIYDTIVQLFSPAASRGAGPDQAA